MGHASQRLERITEVLWEREVLQKLLSKRAEGQKPFFFKGLQDSGRKPVIQVTDETQSKPRLAFNPLKKINNMKKDVARV